MTHGNSSDISFTVNPLNANAENVGKWIKEHMADRTDPASSAPGMPPLYGQDAVPHTMTFQSLVGSFSRAYINPDEAVRDSVNNAHLMEKDVGLLESVECRQRLTALLDWEIIPEDQKCPYQVSLAQELQRIVGRIKHFTKYRMWLMKAIWYGRSGIQHKYGHTRVNGAMRIMPTPLHQDHNGWMPVHGDKLIFRYEDNISTNREEGAYPHQMGIRVGTNMGRDVRIHRDYKLEPVSDGLALFLKPYERDTFCVHKHFIEDAAFHHSYFSGSIHGVGIRSKIYWEWFLKQEAFAFLMQYLERSAGGIEVWTYPMGDDKALKATQEAAREKMANGRNMIFFPKPLGDDSDAYKFEIIEPGAMGLDIMQSIIENYFGGRLKRYILGQELSTEAKATGMGSGVAEAHMDTLSQIVQFDASNLEETMTHELVRYIQQLNFPETLGWHMKFSLKTEDENTMERMEALNSAYQMGASIAESEVFKVLGLSAPTTGQKILSLASQQNAQMQQQMQMQQSMQPQLPMGDDPAQDDSDPEGGPEGDFDPDQDTDTDDDGGGEDGDGDPMEMIKSLMDQYVRDMDRDRYMTQLGFKFDEAKHARESDNIGQKHAGEFAPKHSGIFGHAKPKQKTMFGSATPVAKRRTAKNPLEQIRQIFEHHLNKQKQVQKTIDFDSPTSQKSAPVPVATPAPEPAAPEPASHEGIFGKAKSTERALPTVNPHGKFVKSKTEDEERRDRVFAIANSDRPSVQSGNTANPEPTPEVTPEVEQELAPVTPPRRRMAGQGADAKAVAIPAAPAVQPKQTDPPSVETVPHPSPKADAADNPATSGQPPEKKVYRQVVSKEEKPSNGKSVYDEQDSGIGSKTKSNGWSNERRDQFVSDHIGKANSVVRFMRAKKPNIHEDDALSAAYEGLTNAARTYDDKNEKGYSESKWAQSGMAQAIRNLGRKKMDGDALDSTGSGDEAFDPMAQLADRSDSSDTASNHEQMDLLNEALKMLPENEEWLFRKWHDRAINPQTGLPETRATADEYNQTWGHLHKKEVTANAIGGTNGKIDQIRRKLKDLLPPQKYSIVREYVLRYFRKCLTDMQAERYIRRQDRIISEAAAYTDTDPSDAQIKAGNYKKGRFAWNGMTIVIENPRGSTRRGVSADGEIWKNTMNGHYGYVSRTKGEDGDQIDVIMGRHPQSDIVFVIHQIDQDGVFDEHKCVLGCTNEKQAKELYLSHYPKCWKCGEIEPMTVTDFREWVNK